MPRALLAFFAGALLHALGCSEPLEPLPPPTVARPSASGARTGRGPEPPMVVETPFVLEDGFRWLARADFDSFQAEEDTWQALPEGIRCSGKPKGYLHSKESFQNFTLRLSYRFPWPEGGSDSAQFKGNTGFLVYISGEHKIWPVCLEVQGKYAEMGAIKENGGAARPNITDRDDVREAVRKPVGEWNDLEIVSRDGNLTVRLNGEEVARSEPAFLSSGPIGIQAEGFPFEVRRMRIRLDP